MTHEEKLSAIVQKCIEAKPSIQEVIPAHESFMGEEIKCTPRPIRLDDVMLVLNRMPNLFTFGFRFREHLTIACHDPERTAYWDLASESLDEQPPELIDFLYDLLSPHGDPPATRRASGAARPNTSA